MTAKEAKKDPVFWGRLVVSVVGTYLINSIRGAQIELFYWREEDRKVEFILKQGKSLVVIEVKSRKESLKSSRMDSFVQKYHPNRVLLVGK